MALEPMGVFSVHQPFAQLIARGLMPFVPRPGATPHRGRVAIHAVSAAPSHELLRFALKHPRLARTFATQGWTSREQLLALPRGAIVGTVELRTVRPVRDVLLDPGRADRTPHDRIDITAAGGDGRHDPDAFVMPVWPDDYLYMLANAIEIAPIMGVTGTQGVWELSMKHTRLVAAAERGIREALLSAAAARRGEVAASRSRRRAREGLDQAEVQRRALEAKGVRDAAREKAALEHDLRWFEEDAMEARFQRALSRYLTQYPPRRGDGLTQIRIAGPLPQSLFPGATWVALLEFERRVRVHFREVLRAKTRPRPARDPLWDLPWHLPKLAKLVEIGAAAGVHYQSKKRRRGKDAARQAPMPKLDGEPQVHVQRDDPHDPPDPRDYGGKGG